MRNHRDWIYERYLSTTYAPRNDLSDKGLQQSAQHYARYFSKSLPADKEANIIEIGCGSGAMLMFLRDAGFRHVVGVDISPEQVEFCRAHGIDNVHEANGLDFLKATDDRFDLIILSDVLEHLTKEEVLDMLTEVGRKLGHGGNVIVRVPNLSNPLNVRTRYVDFTHQVGFTAESLAQVFRVAGLSVTSVEGEFSVHRRRIARWLFDVFLWRLFRIFHHHVMHLVQEPVRGKNLIAIGNADPT